AQRARSLRSAVAPASLVCDREQNGFAQRARKSQCTAQEISKDRHRANLGRESRGDRRAKEEARGMARTVAVSLCETHTRRRATRLHFFRNVACHSRKNSFGNRVKIRGSTSEKMKPRRSATRVRFT